MNRRQITKRQSFQTLKNLKMIKGVQLFDNDERRSNLLSQVGCLLDLYNIHAWEEISLNRTDGGFIFRLVQRFLQKLYINHQVKFYIFVIPHGAVYLSVLSPCAVYLSVLSPGAVYMYVPSCSRINKLEQSNRKPK